jgi:hypothetical protein
MLRRSPARRVVALALLIVFASSGATAFGQGVVTPLAPEPFTVPASQLHFFQIDVATSVRVAGRFRAEGGRRNDIAVFLLDRDGLENYSNGHGTQTYYNSGRKTVGSIDVTLGKGTYFLIFDNQFSSFSNKVVRTDITLQ